MVCHDNVEDRLQGTRFRDARPDGRGVQRASVRTLDTRNTVGVVPTCRNVRRTFVFSENAVFPVARSKHGPP